MALLNQALLRPWLDSLDGIDWLNFRGHRLHALKYLREIAIHPVLLHAATRFWDPEVHVFRFGSQELCPTVEEFHAYLGSHDSTEPIVPMLRESMKNIVKAKLGVSGNVAEFLTRGNAINIVQLYERFSPPGDSCCICLLAAFLLVPPVGQPSSLLVGVAAQIEARKDVAPLVLAETLMGLDAVHAGRTRIWLCDKLNLLTPPANDWWYRASGWNRPFQVMYSNEDDWADFFASAEEDDIAWRCHWLRLPAMTVSNMGSTHVFVAGLTGFTFYSPFRILRQLGHSQEVPPPGSEVLRLLPFTIPGLWSYVRTWEARRTEPNDPLFSIASTGRYRKWLRRDVEARMG
ncbi:hypothetical protein RHMOL_Rhmol02G0192000 [Rhododendron molle]|uniref:Uncharacterized protein n=1 Tax=Rhododendron molle TaxID=49168 RepID=A0ACC0PTG8_RHOML|nr:hypothetical protein RHMOL_Rhmol02G0192000 [Rhododendron molle]